MTNGKVYRFVRNLPVADFWYQGNHSHPVRRKVLVTESNRKFVRGYEVRCGSIVNNLDEAPVKTYRRDSIAKIGQLDKRRVLKRNTPKSKHTSTTLVRKALESLLVEGF